MSKHVIHTVNSVDRLAYALLDLSHFIAAHESEEKGDHIAKACWLAAEVLSVVTEEEDCLEEVRAFFEQMTGIKLTGVKVIDIPEEEVEA